MSNIGLIMDELYEVVIDRINNPKEGSYTNYLIEKGVDKIAKKVGEEAVEVVIAAKNERRSDTVAEVSDLLYHLTVLLVQQGISLDEIYDELKTRR
ncbi:MAG: phosphoribosyl-ATP diphosphatase [Eubacteriales bacterium]|nr:phosphoribosyl-ATP diphosphatase [Eubacteriales bacterium]MDD4327818.1 phosphoribosyl-ATP diphosphatase [Eubacteriales bacterium]MDD4717856.1 phosphoribosyl-ATP diphosphatase [Eubacteriales bacterium]